MTQQQLADAAAVDSKTIYNLESRGKWPIARTRASIEKALGWPLGEIQRLAETEPRPNLYPNVPPDLAEYILRRHGRDLAEAEAILADMDEAFSRRPRPEPGEDAPRRRAV